MKVFFIQALTRVHTNSLPLVPSIISINLQNFIGEDRNGRSRCKMSSGSGKGFGKKIVDYW
jgi:hypothetical protein